MVVRVVSPASPVTDEVLALGCGLASELGLELELELTAPGLHQGMETSFAAGGRHYLAGSDLLRAEVLTRALSECQQVWMARGGYGSARLLTVADEGLRERWRGSLWAFSDGTALIAMAYAWGRSAWSAPPLSQLPRLDGESRVRLVEAMRYGRVAPFEGLEVTGRALGETVGEVEGKLFVANLAVLASLCGTPLMPSLEGALLVVEDVNEPAFRVDRFFWQLMASGALCGVRALVAGAFTGVDEREQVAIAAVLAEVGRALGVPVVFGLPVGHGERNACLPIGRRARLCTAHEAVRLEVEAASRDGRDA